MLSKRLDWPATLIPFACVLLLGRLTVKQKKNPRRPHKSCIFLSNFMFLSVLVCNSVL